MPGETKWQAQEWEFSVEVRIRLTNGDTEDLASLADWLSSEREFRGHLRLIPAPITDTDLGGPAELITVALSAGGAVTVLARSMVTWLQTRRTTAKLTIEVEGRSVVLEMDTVQDIRPLLSQILEITDDRDNQQTDPR